MTQVQKPSAPGTGTDYSTTRTQYMILLSAEQLQSVRHLSFETNRSIQSLLREGVDLVLTKHTKKKPPKKKPGSKA